ncbi:MAG TPA: hypothetical protein VGJ49_06300 [Gaiellaceae bacterium]
MTHTLVANSRTAGRRRLGELLVLRGLVVEQDVAEALVEQRRSRRRLGQILLDRGVLSRAALESTLAEQAGQLEPERGFGGGLRAAISGHATHAEPPRSEGGRPLGRLLVSAGHVTDADINDALAEQARSGELLGEILVKRGAVSQPVLSLALEEQGSASIEMEHGFGTGLRDALAEASVKPTTH